MRGMRDMKRNESVYVCVSDSVYNSPIAKQAVCTAATHTQSLHLSVASVNELLSLYCTHLIVVKLSLSKSLR